LFQNFADVFEALGTGTVFPYALKNSLISYFVSLVAGTGLALIFSFYVYKKFPLHGLVKVVLFTPSIISGMVLVSVFVEFVNEVIPSISFMITGTKMMGLIANPSSQFGAVLFYCIWIGFGGSILLYVGAMNNIDESMIEAGVLDGTNSVTEFLFIVFPSIYSTFIVFFTTALIAVFTHQMNLYSFYGGSARFDLYTLGYYLYRETQGATLSQYPYLAAMGIIFTLIATPVTLGLKRLLEKIGPSTDGGH
jgi:ABC-type sugar transport system permease subunit